LLPDRSGADRFETDIELKTGADVRIDKSVTLTLTFNIITFKTISGFSVLITCLKYENATANIITMLVMAF